MRRALWIALALLLLAVAGFALRTLQVAGALRELEPHARGVEGCRIVEGPVGPEDVTVHPETGVAFVSASDRRARARGEPVPGALWSYDLGRERAEPVNRTPDAGVGFQPHGISLWVGPEGGARLFAISHAPEGVEGPPHSVEVFDVAGSELRHRASWSGAQPSLACGSLRAGLRPACWSDERLVMPNDLVAVGPERLYLTNTHANPPGLLQTLETYLRIPAADLLFRGPEGWRVAASDLLFPNGINASPDGGTIYVATTTTRELLVFDRDAGEERLALRERVFLGSGGDNVEVDAEGSIWIGAHPKLFALLAHRDDPESRAPSQVLRVERREGGFAVDEVMLRVGDRFSAASAAARWKDRLLVGQIFDEGLLDCALTSPFR